MSGNSIVDFGKASPLKKEKGKDMVEPTSSDPLLLSYTEIWVNEILPFIGPGNFIFVAGVSHRFKEFYKKYFATIEKRPGVYPSILETTNIPRVQATACATFYGAAFSSLSRAEFWEKETQAGGDCPMYTPNDLEMVCCSVARAGNLQVFKWADRSGFPWGHQACMNASKYGCIEILKYAHDCSATPSWEKCHQEAAAGGHLDIVKWIHKKGCPLTKETCASAAGHGKLKILKYLHENGCPWDEFSCEIAARRGHVDCLRFMHENGCEWSWRTCSSAASLGHLEVLMYAHENGCHWDEDVCSLAAEKGHLETLKYAHENGCPWNEDTCHQAVANGHLDILKYAHENGCPWDEDICSWAAAEGHLETLKYAHENGCPWDENTCSRAALTGHLDALQYAHENGCQWDEHTCSEAARAGNLHLLKWAHENGCPWDYRTLANAAQRRHWEIVEYAHAHGCQWGAYTCERAYKRKLFDRIMQMHEHGCPWGDFTCADAATISLKILKYAHENGCAWGTLTCAIAAGKKNVGMLQYLHKNGCPSGGLTCADALWGLSFDVLKYAHENGYPWGKNFGKYFDTEMKQEQPDERILTYAIENGAPGTDAVTLMDENKCGSALRNVICQAKNKLQQTKSEMIKSIQANMVKLCKERATEQNRMTKYQSAQMGNPNPQMQEYYDDLLGSCELTIQSLSKKIDEHKDRIDSLSKEIEKLADGRGEGPISGDSIEQASTTSPKRRPLQDRDDSTRVVKQKAKLPSSAFDFYS